MKKETGVHLGRYVTSRQNHVIFLLGTQASSLPLGEGIPGLLALLWRNLLSFLCAAMAYG